MPSNRSLKPAVLTATVVVLVALAGLVSVALLLAIDGVGAAGICGATAGAAAGARVALGPAGSGIRVGATEYGGPGDPSSGSVGSSGVSLLTEPNSYAELGGTTFATADAMGGLPYGTPLRITWGGHSVIAYKRDIGLGGGPIDGYPRVIDLWWKLARRLGIPYEGGRWSGPVSIARTPSTGAGNILGAVAPSPAALAAAGDAPGAATIATAGGVCVPTDGIGVLQVNSGPRAILLPDGEAAAPAGAPAAVKAMIAAGNQIAGKPYVYGGGHGLPLSGIAPSYDCSSSVDHLLYGGGLLPAVADLTSGQLESWGSPGPGRWVTIYASPEHVFMYVAGLRWDTYNAAGPGDGSIGIGWHPLVRGASGFVVRHPVGL